MGNLLNMSGGSLLNKGLPYDYEVEYLESSGTQFINTQTYTNTDDNSEVGCYVKSPLPLSMRDFFSPYGAMHGWYNKSFSFIWNTAQELYFLFGNQKGMYVKKSLGNFTNSWHVFKIQNQKGYFDDELIGSYTEGYVESDFPLWLFCTNNGNLLYGGITSKRISYFKLSDNLGTLKLDLIPVVKDNVGYMYDKVSGQLFGNSGTGDFILGPDKTN